MHKMFIASKSSQRHLCGTLGLIVKSMLETIGFSRRYSVNELARALSLLFPDLQFKQIELDKLDDASIDDKDTAYFTVIETNSDFPMRIELYSLPEQNTELREQYIGMKAAEILQCKTTVGYQGKGYEQSPFHCLIFDGINTFLATDDSSAYAGDGENDIQLIGELPNFRISEFDSRGKIK